MITGDPFVRLLGAMEAALKLCHREKITVPKEFMAAKARIAKSNPNARLFDDLSQGVSV